MSNSLGDNLSPPPQRTARESLMDAIDAFGAQLSGEVRKSFGGAGSGSGVHVLDQIAMLRKLRDLREELRTGKAYQ